VTATRAQAWLDGTSPLPGNPSPICEGWDPEPPLMIDWPLREITIRVTLMRGENGLWVNAKGSVIVADQPVTPNWPYPELWDSFTRLPGDRRRCYRRLSGWDGQRNMRPTKNLSTELQGICAQIVHPVRPVRSDRRCLLLCRSDRWHHEASTFGVLDDVPLARAGPTNLAEDRDALAIAFGAEFPTLGWLDTSREDQPSPV
jgi:hypothetical protein